MRCFLPTQTTSYGNPTWKIFLEAKAFIELLWELKLPPTNVDKLAKLDNRNDSTCGLIDMSISPNL